MKKVCFFFLIVSFFVSLPIFNRANNLASQEALNISPAERLKQIDQELDELENLKRRYQASYDSRMDEATRWQFNDEEQMESRQEYERADEDQKKIDEIDNKIKQLQKQKEELLKNYPELKEPALSHD